MKLFTVNGVSLKPCVKLKVAQKSVNDRPLELILVFFFC